MMDMEKLCQLLLAKMDAIKEEMKADRKTDKEEMKAYQAKAEAMLAKLDAYQEKAAADRMADKEEIKAEMRSMWSELDDKIQHKIKISNPQEELTKTCAAIQEIKRNFQARLAETRQTRTERGNTPTVIAGTVLQPTFHGSSTWSVFRHFETVAEHNQWSEKKNQHT
jgi:small-conductance mechanosensitive channel